MKTIGLVGLKGSGKDTFARLFADALMNKTPARSVALDAFARPLHELASAVFGFDCSGATDRERRERPHPLGPSGAYAPEYLELAARFPHIPSFSVLGELLLIHEEMPRSISPRGYLNGIGEGLKRAFGANIWVERVQRDAPECDVRILTDVRFPQELSACDETFLIHRRAPEPADFDAPAERMAAEMIFGMQPGPRLIYNNRDLQALKDHAKRIAESY